MKQFLCVTLAVTAALLAAEAHASNDYGHSLGNSNAHNVGNVVPVVKGQGFFYAGHVKRTRANVSTDEIPQPMPPKVPTVEEITRRCPPQDQAVDDGIPPPPHAVRNMLPTPAVQPVPPMSPKIRNVELTDQSIRPVARPATPPPTAFEQLFRQ